jgi:hypothetical protein
MPLRAPYKPYHFSRGRILTSLQTGSRIEPQRRPIEQARSADQSHRRVRIRYRRQYPDYRGELPAILRTGEWCHV